jgi:hypothetical protein
VSLFLSPEELHILTGKIRRHAQIEALRVMGIDHVVRPDGTAAVLQSHVERRFGGSELVSNRARKTSPNFSAIS